MKAKKYSSFEEIEQDMRILQLQREIDEEKLKYAFQSTKEELYPTNLLGGFSGIAKKLALSFVTSKILKSFK
ncbi:DUF6327 family protein [Flagellimonas hadalis]|uniref:Glutaminyl-tRNA synthetase n=2 Tax=Flagellimonas TaxID=444459 RepID=A0A5N5IV32_9FLAO|nr:DUF6327 family protein [Allomuricauda hadalis]KAB5488947.1 hypothetical protein FOT42_009680 [Allomuricauda hadalis]RUA11154.1 MAG: hypothetical protein DSY83_16985 [Flavobacteriia bacterium]